MRRLLSLAVVVVLAGCRSAASASITSLSPAPETPTAEPTSSAQASASSAPATPAEAADATLVVVAGGAVGGPGMSIADAIAAAGDEPVLVNGVLLKDIDDSIWLCQDMVAASPPECGDPRLRVENYPEGGAEFDLEGAELTGLQEADGVRWLEGNQLYGRVHP